MTIRPATAVKIICLLALAASSLVAGPADVTERSYVFSNPGDYLGWTTGNMSSTGVSDGYLWAVTSTSAPYMPGPDNLNLTARMTHYVQIRMRALNAAGSPATFGASTGKVYISTSATPEFNETNKVQFKTYGTGTWKTYNIWVGGHFSWRGTIKQIRIDPVSQAGVRLEIAWIKIMQDNTPPEFTVEHKWTYQDGDTISDRTPSLSLQQVYDEVSNVAGCEFYIRPGASTSESDWKMDGYDSYGTNGWQFRYKQQNAGTYDLGVKVYDKAGNVGYWVHGNKKWIDNLTIDSAATTSINVDASALGDVIKKDINGNNIHWTHWGDQYDPATGLLPPELDQRIREVGVTTLRYPGGCFADTFFWKKSIGPLATRTDQFVNPCAPVLGNQGKVKFGIDEFLRTCERLNLKPMITCRFRWPGSFGVPGVDPANAYDAALADAIDLVEYCNAPNNGSNPNGGTDWAAVRATNGHPQPYNVKLWEVGNEPFGPDPWGSPSKLGLDGASVFSQAFISYMSGMLSVDSSITVAPSAHLAQQLTDYDLANPKWAYSMYHQLGDRINTVQFHMYYPYNGKQTNLTELYKETMASPKAFDDDLATQRAVQKMAMPERQDLIRLWLSEVTITYNWADDESQGMINSRHTRTLKAALATADTIRIFYLNQDLVDSAQWWLLYGDSYWSAIYDDNVNVTPAYHVYRLFNELYGTQLVGSKVVAPTTFDYLSPGGVTPLQYDLSHLTAQASRNSDGSSLYLMVINKDLDVPRTATVNLSNFAPAGSQLDAQVWVINGPDVDDSNVPSSVTTTRTTQQFGTSFSYSFPAHSVTGFKFTLAHPEVTIGAPSVAVTSTGPVDFPISYVNASSITLSPADVALVKTGTADASVQVLGSGAAARTVRLSNITGDGTIAIQIAAGTAVNGLSLAPAAGPSDAVSVDNTAPAVAIGPAALPPTHSGPVVYDVTYTGASNISLTPGEITLHSEGSAAGTVEVSDSGSLSRTVTVTNITGSGTLWISIAAGSATDAAGNAAGPAGPSAQAEVMAAPMSLSQAKRCGDGSSVAIGGPSSPVVTAVFSGYFYAQSLDHTTGLRVVWNGSVAPGSGVAMNGTMRTAANGERYLEAATVTVFSMGAPPIGPAAAKNVYTGGSDWFYYPSSGAGQRGVVNGKGLNTTGMLVRASGKVTHVDAGAGLYTIWDGTRLTATPLLDQDGYEGIRVQALGTRLPVVGDFVIITGISSLVASAGNLYALILPRSPLDVSFASDPVELPLHDAKAMPPGQAVKMSGGNAPVVTAVFPGFFYVEKPDQTGGMRVVSTTTVYPGDQMSLAGKVQVNADSERYLELTSAPVLVGTNDVKPLVMRCTQIGGEDFRVNPRAGTGQVGMFHGIGLNTVGLLVTIAGRVTALDPGAKTATIWDGSKWTGLDLIDSGGSLGVKVRFPGPALPAQSDFPVVTGVVSCELVGGKVYPVVLALE